MKWQLFKWKDGTRRELEYGPTVDIPTERDCPDVLIHEGIIYQYSESGGMFIEADVFPTAVNFKEHTRQGANLISELLLRVLMDGESEKRHLYTWERKSIEWLREQWRIDPGTVLNMWTADRYISNKTLDLDAKLLPK